MFLNFIALAGGGDPKTTMMMMMMMTTTMMMMVVVMVLVLVEKMMTMMMMMYFIPELSTQRDNWRTVRRETERDTEFPPADDPTVPLSGWFPRQMFCFHCWKNQVKKCEAVSFCSFFISLWYNFEVPIAMRTFQQWLTSKKRVYYSYSIVLVLTS